MPTTKTRGFVDNEFMSSRGSVYTVEVDYGLKVDDVRPNYDYVGVHMHENLFPPHRSGVEKVELHLVRFKADALHGNVKSFDFLSEFLGLHGLRSASLQELLAFDLAQPHLKHRTGYSLSDVLKLTGPPHAVVPGVYTDISGQKYLHNVYTSEFTPNFHYMMTGMWRILASPVS